MDFFGEAKQLTDSIGLGARLCTQEELFDNEASDGPVHPQLGLCSQTAAVGFGCLTLDILQAFFVASSFGTDCTCVSQISPRSYCCLLLPGCL